MDIIIIQVARGPTVASGSLRCVLGPGRGGCVGSWCIRGRGWSRVEVAPVAESEPTAAVHADDVLPRPLCVHDGALAVPLTRGWVLDPDWMPDADGGEVVGGAVVALLHALRSPGHVSFAVPEVVPPLPADAVVTPKCGDRVSQLPPVQQLGW